MEKLLTTCQNVGKVEANYPQNVEKKISFDERWAEKDPVYLYFILYIKIVEAKINVIALATATGKLGAITP